MLLPATRTGLRRRQEAVNFDDPLTALERHPFEDAHELSKAEIAYLAPPQGFHALQVQVLKVQRIVFIAQPMRQLEVKVTALVCHVRAVLGIRPPRSFPAFRSIPLARQLTIEALGLADGLREKLWVAIASAFVVGQERFQTEVESADFTRAGWFDLQFLNDAEHKPQPSDLIPLDGERLDLPAHLAVLDELVPHTVNRDRTAFDFVAGLRERERRIAPRLSELRRTFRQFVEEALVSIVNASAHVLTDLRVQIAPQGEPLCFTQLQDVLIHLMQRDIFSGEAVVAFLERDEVIPHRRRNKQLMPQLSIFLVSAVQTVLVHLANSDRIAHALTAPLSECWWALQRRDQHLYFSTDVHPTQPDHLKRLKQVKPLYPTAKAGGFYGLVHNCDYPTLMIL
jgi:hypothetical protein